LVTIMIMYFQMLVSLMSKVFTVTEIWRLLLAFNFKCENENGSEILF